MKLSWFTFALKNNLRNRRRSLVTMTIAALGSAAILLAAGFANSTYEALEQASARSTGHVIVARPEQFQKEEDSPLQYGLENPAGLEQRLLSQPEVRYVLPRIDFNGLISNGDKSTIMVAIGIDPDSEFAIKGPFLKRLAGEMLSSHDKEAGILLGDTLAKSLKAQPGTNLTLMSTTVDGALNAMDVNVKGIVSTGIPDLDKRLVYSDIRSAQKLLNSNKISSMGVFLQDINQTAELRQKLQQDLPQLGFETWLDKAFFYKSVRDLYNRIFGSLGAIITLIVIFVVANAMAMAIIERTREIGSLRAMGTLPSQLIRSFSYEGMLLGVCGAICGALFASLVSFLLYSFPVQMPPPPGRSDGYPLLVNITAPLYLLTIGGILILSGLSSAWIARRTMNKSIPEALAHT